MKILGLETSCDETAAAVIENGTKVFSNIVSSQVDLHAETGGIVPEVAARAHIENIILVIQKALDEAGITKDDVDTLAVTIGPGLIPSLLIGTETAQALAYAWEKPIIGVQHIEGHIYSNRLLGKDGQAANFNFPLLCLIVSGGHTSLILMRDHIEYEIIGETRDDAAGEAFDKVAKILGLGYPGGPAISKEAENGDPSAIDFPRPMTDSKDFDFSFSGLKTAVLLHVKEQKDMNDTQVADIAASFQQAAIDVLVKKTVSAADKYQVKQVLLGGGVAANKELRTQLKAGIKKHAPSVEYVQPDLEFTTDNAAMIAAAAYEYAKRELFTPWEKIIADANLKLAR